MNRTSTDWQADRISDYLVTAKRANSSRPTTVPGQGDRRVPIFSRESYSAVTPLVSASKDLCLLLLGPMSALGAAVSRQDQSAGGL